MSKIKVCRASGMPVQIDNIEKFQDEMKLLFDKVMVRLGQDPEKPVVMEEDIAKRGQKLLDRLENILLKKYPAIEYWEPIVESDKWVELTKKHGPIMVAATEDNELAYVIYDVQI